MALLCTVSFAAGVVFMALGAWPVAGFFGLDVLVLWLAFKLNYRAGRQFEVIELGADALVVTRVSPSGLRQAFDFNPYWVRLHLDETVDGRTRLRLKLHARELIFGGFLNDEERRGVAEMLGVALAQARGRSS